MLYILTVIINILYLWLIGKWCKYDKKLLFYSRRLFVPTNGIFLVTRLGWWEILGTC